MYNLPGHNQYAGVLPACALHADREAVRINCLLHPPLNPLPSREGKEKKELPLKEGKERNSHQGRGIYPLGMGRNLLLLIAKKRSFGAIVTKCVVIAQIKVTYSAAFSWQACVRLLLGLSHL